jgi:cobalamin biosynthesis protein CobT
MKNDRVFILRESVVKITQMLSGRGIRVTQQGLNAYVKSDPNGTPISVNLPYLPDNATEELCAAIQGFLDHEVAHILFTEFTVMGEAMKHGKQVGFMVNALEDPRIEKCMGERFAGSKHNLAVTSKFFLDKFIVPRLVEERAKGDSNAVIQTLMVPMIRAMSGQLVFQEFMSDKWKLVAPVYDKIKDLAPRLEAATSTRDCLDIALEIKKRLTKDRSEEESEGEGESKSKSKSAKSKGESKGKAGTSTGEAGDSEGSTGEESEETEDTPGEAEKPDDKEDESKDSAESDESEGSEGSEGGDDIVSDVITEDEDEVELEEPGVPKVTGSASETKPGTADADSTLTSPMWDELDKDGLGGYDEMLSDAISKSATKSAGNATYLPFTKDHDLVEKLPVGRSMDKTMTARIIDAVEHMVAPLQKDLERAVAARSLATRSHGHRSGRLHSANLSRLAVNDTRVFSRKHESTSKDVAVELVVDASGSMSGSRIAIAAQAAYALSAVLDRLNIKNEVICFSTKDIRGLEEAMYKEERDKGVRFSRVEGLYMPILKGYEERMVSNVKDRFAWLPHANILRNNVDGECVEIAARRLLARREAGKIMIVLSDGEPCAAGSRTDLQCHLKHVVREVESAGVKVVGIGIQTTSVQEYYPKNIVLNDISTLPTTVIKELRHLLLGV